MKQQLTISVPKDYSAVTLSKYLLFKEDLESYKDEEGANDVIVFNHICGVPAELVKKIDTETYNKIRNDLQSFMSNVDYPLQRIIRIGDVEYGFEPNLSKMSYGAYLDISKWDAITIDRNWSKIMAVLYRPVTKKVGTSYEIQEYNGENVDEKIWDDVGMHIHFGALFFFTNLLKELVSSTLNSLKGEQAIPQNILSILERNGNLIRPL
jgi:hypothetical protein